MQIIKTKNDANIQYNYHTSTLCQRLGVISIFIKIHFAQDAISLNTINYLISQPNVQLSEEDMKKIKIHTRDL